jgi:hypothetical protein
MSEEIAVIDNDEPPYEVVPIGNLFGTNDPAQVLAKATATADVLVDVVKKKKLIQRIGPNDHVRVEGWTLLGSMLGVFPVVVWTRKLEDGWEARAEAKTLGGAVVGGAEAECLRAEKNWQNRDDYALRSMAQTRAISKAMRMPLGFIVQLAGFNPTPAEEMPESGSGSRTTSHTGAGEPDPVDLQHDFGDPELTFGKFKGKKLSEVPAKYREWLVENYTPTDEHTSYLLDAVKDSLIPF